MGQSDAQRTHKMAMQWTGVVKSLGKLANASTKLGAGSIQKRYVGNLPVRTNSYIENWAHRRENIEHEFTFSARNVGIIALTGVLVPFFLYKGCVGEFVSVFLA